MKNVLLSIAIVLSLCTVSLAQEAKTLDEAKVTITEDLKIIGQNNVVGEKVVELKDGSKVVVERVQYNLSGVVDALVQVKTQLEFLRDTKKINDEIAKLEAMKIRLTAVKNKIEESVGLEK